MCKNQSKKEDPSSSKESNEEEITHKNNQTEWIPFGWIPLSERNDFDNEYARGLFR